MKLRELIESLSEKQKRTVKNCLDRCGIYDLEQEVDPYPREDVKRFLKVISNPIRYGILKMLRDKWMCVCLISKALDVDQTLVSHHIRILKEAELLEERREGKLRFYRTNKEKFMEYLRAVMEEIGYEGATGGSE
ncbi:ArsR/SmtB family transcription factor [Pyrococcus abyssi]|uniref:Transcription regulator ArsR n=1 Tax=Pyrococcus abyssi (strain GE5 / Orsay) TaxID=272844 RepID=Q9V2K4_PYRAB|nr:metalloregulator ArsR/SmtB family transcription factor [Pyrococcus abyssi]CAB48994.1 Transcriptional regulator, arsR family [Pyrococcus abyssi GE5]CCE69443.1 TPA: transcription regulator ArsR [Pyrococcus abyssi GE5]